MCKQWLEDWILGRLSGGSFTDKPIELPRGSIKKLIGKDLTWKDEPVEII